MTNVHKWPAIFAFAAACGTAGCASPPSGSGDAVTDRENQAVTDLKSQYKDVVMGTDVQGRTLAIYVDVNNFSQLDDEAQAAMEQRALGEWKRVWTGGHPRKHGLLKISLRDYYGKEIYSTSTRA